jgi:calcium-dependent protein kinase
VKYYETFEDPKYLYLVMEYCTKGDLMQKISSLDRPMSEHDAAYITSSILKALIHCNKNNTSHMDIKPENIMQGGDGDVKLIDFGLSRVIQTTSEEKGTVGSLYFIAPEIFRGEYSPKCDVWSLGVVLFLLLSMSYPFKGVDKDHTRELIMEGRFSMKG